MKKNKITNDLKPKLNKPIKDDLYPVEYNGKMWSKNECNDLFVSMYGSIHSLNDFGGVYLTDGVWIYPDGEMSEF